MVDPDQSTQGAPERIGDYKIISVLGEGGMGLVYLADQERPLHRRVALKVIKLGMDSREVVARFEMERQALALMDHPNVAKVLQAGTTSEGRPFFVMEFVPGIPITDYCDRQRLSTSDRLELFLQVCQAVQHAHQKGIIHRDIKPSNVLVAVLDGKPIPKVIDFGLAKATNQRLTEKTVFTIQGRMLGTPAYMSPEQAEMSGLDVDTRTDIYSLGVLLYELLAGTPPFDAGTLHAVAFEELIRTIREVEPPKPSARVTTLGTDSTPVAERRRTDARSLIRQLRGDLDWITLKAMEKDRTRRYASASELEADIRRHLRNEPVQAGPPSAFYQLRKFARRNRVGVAAALAVFLALASGLGVSTALYLQAKRARVEAEVAGADAERARREAESDRDRAVGAEALAQKRLEETRIEADKAVAARDFLVGMVAAPDPERGNRDVRVADVLAKSGSRIDAQFDGQPEVQAFLHDALGSTYQGLGLLDKALPHFDSALKIRRRILPKEDAMTIKSMNNLGLCLQHLGKLSEAEALLLETLETERSALGEEHQDTLVTSNNLVLLLYSQGKYSEAEALCRQTMGIQQRVLGKNHQDTLNSLNSLGSMVLVQGRYAEAEPLLREALAGQRELLGAEHPKVTTIMLNLGILLQRKGDFAESELMLRNLLEIQKRSQGEEHPQTLITMNALAVSLQAQDRLEEAIPLLRSALEIQRRTLGEEHSNTLDSMTNLAFLLHKHGDLEEAQSLSSQGVERRRRILGDAHPATLTSLKKHVQILEAAGKKEEATEYQKLLPPPKAGTPPK